MTTANALYLFMVIGAFAVFSATLAYASWLQSRQGPEFIRQPAQPARPQPALAHRDAALAA